MRTALKLSAVLVCAVGLTGLLACTGPTVEFVVTDASYVSTQLRTVLERTDVSQLADEPASEARTLRRSALADLRAQGDGAAEAADLITETFPPDTRSVPVYVERAEVNGTSAYIIIEAWGPSSGTLNDRRLWVIDSKTGDVIFSAAAE